MKVLLDCGSYSAFADGFTIDLGAYIAFIENNRRWLHRYISLDQIPGKNGRRGPDPEAAKRSYANHRKMLDAGLAPWPVVHRQDDLRWLERYLADGEQYICLAPHPMSERHEVFAWLRECFALVPSSVAIHGLGLTTAVMLKHFQFTSVDSASWVNAASNGLIYLPRFRRGQPDYSLAPYTLSVTARSLLRDNHFVDADPVRREQVEWCLADAGVTFQQVAESKPARMKICLRYYQGLARATDTTIYFVTNTDREQRETLSQCGAATRLLSFAELQNKSANVLEDYVREVPR
jgi:hypothetical protein